MNLLEFKFDKYTTTGNDGIIEKILNVLDIKNGFFVEFGAWDGVKGSNCRKLFEEGWSGIFIESDLSRYNKLKQNYKEYDNIICINSMVDRGLNKFDNLVREHVENKIDFCSIDIDGLDLEIFETFNEFLPTVVCIEGGQMVEPSMPRLPEHIASRNIQQSLKIMVESFRSRGYEVLCSYQDTFFVKKEFSHLFDTPNSIIELYLDGLLAHHRRMPWIQFVLKQSHLNNKIIDYILQQSNYNRYGYNNRKLWAKEEKKITFEVINSLKNKFLNKE